MGLFSSKSSKNAKNKPKQGVKLTRTVQESIPYYRVYENGTIETEKGVFTRAYNMGDLNFKIAPDDEQITIFRAYGKFLNSFPNGTKFQIVVQNTNADKRSSMREIHLEMQRDNQNKLRQEINDLLLERLAEGKQNLRQEKYLVVSIEDENVDHAMAALDKLNKEIQKSFKHMSRNLDVRPMTLEERLYSLFSIYNQDGEGIFYNEVDKDGNPRFNIATVYRSGLGSKDVIGPSGMEFKNPNYFMLGNIYGRALYLENVPTFVSTDFISDLSDVTTNMLISLHHDPIETGKAIRMVNTELMDIYGQISTAQQKAYKNGYSAELISPKLETSKKLTRDLMDDLTIRDQRLYYVTMTVTLFAKTLDELKEYVGLIETISAKHMCPLKTLSMQQQDGLNASLPLCYNKLAVKRMMTTESASIFIPYTSMELYQKQGIFYGLNQISNNMIFYDKMTGDNYNSLVFGHSGGGKTGGVKWEIMMTYLKKPNVQIFIIDPESDYHKVVKALDGEVIRLAPGEKAFFNPLDMDVDYDGESDPVAMKFDYILSMVEIMLGDGRSLDPSAKSVLNRCVRNIYKGYLQHMQSVMKTNPKFTCDKDAMPTLNMLYNELLRQDEPEAQSVAAILEPYAVGSYALFAHRSNVETNCRVIDYDVKNLGAGMKNLGLFVCLNDIWNKMIENRKKNIWTAVYIDEFYLMLQSDTATRFLMEIWKRARKWYGMPCGIMQNTEDLLRTSEARNILNNSSFIQMYSLPTIDRANLGELLQISDAQLEYITNSDPGHGLIYTGKTILPFNNEIPEDTMLFDLIQSSREKKQPEMEFVGDKA